MMTLYMRPYYEGLPLKAIAVCTTNEPLLVDEQVLEWFEADVTGIEIREHYADHEDGPFHVEWGKVL